MSVTATRSLTGLAATTFYDAIGVARTANELDGLASSIWRGVIEGEISEHDADYLIGYIERRRPWRRRPLRLPTVPSVLLPDPNLQCVGRLFPRRRPSRSPDKQASCDRRHRLAYSGVMPHHLAGRLTPGDMAVMRVVADEYRRLGCCELSRDEVAARAGVCPMTVRRAMNKARNQCLIRIDERPVHGRKHLTNLVQIISHEWLKWLRRPLISNEKARRIEPIKEATIQREQTGVHLRSPTDKNLEGDCVHDRNLTEMPETATRPQSERLTKETAEFAAELARICAYQQAIVSRSREETNSALVVRALVERFDATKGVHARRRRSRWLGTSADFSASRGKYSPMTRPIERQRRMSAGSKDHQDQR